MESNKEKSILQLNKVRNRILKLSPTVALGIERECCKSDFLREGDRPIGRGGFGEVWKVIHKATGRVYVIKVINKKNIIDQKMGDQMNREIDIMYKLDHPYIVKLVNHFEDDDSFYLVMHYASKGQLYSLLRRNIRFDQRTAAQFMREIISSLKFLHSFDPPIIHRDIKPENILLDENSRVQLADFGWSNYCNDEESRKTYCGTPEYLAPEMLKKSGHDTSVDIWSLGVLLFELLCGHSPFHSTSQEELFNNIRKHRINWPTDFPPLAKNLISKILKPNPKDRIGLEEILAHSWFEKNTPLRPLTEYVKRDKESLLQSHMINIDTSKLANSALSNGNSNEIIRQSITKQMNGANASNSSNSEMNAALKNTLETISKENDELSKLNKELQSRNEQLENEIKNLKIEFVKFKESAMKTKEIEEENKKIKEEIQHWHLLNKDRLAILTELEEKNNQITENLKNIHQLKADFDQNERNLSGFKEKITDLEKIRNNQDNIIQDLRNQIHQISNEHEIAKDKYEKRIELLQIKIFETSSNDEESNSTMSKLLEILNDSIEDLKTTFNLKSSKLIGIMEEIKSDLTKSDSTLKDMITEKSEIIAKLCESLKHSFDDDVQRIKNRLTNDDKLKNKENEKVEWFKKQLSELQPYKNKYNNIENSVQKYETQIKFLQNKLETYENWSFTSEKLITRKNEKIEQLNKYIQSIEAKLCDVKDYVFKNYSDRIEEFMNCFKNY